MTTLPGTLARPDRTYKVCVFHVDGEDHEHRFFVFGSEYVARHSARKLIDEMRGTPGTARSVSIQRPDGTWETLGTIHDVGIAA